MRLGIMGGTFDPIHFGHLFIAEEARNRFGLERVLFVPNGNPPHKEGRNLTPAPHRYAMTCLATASNPSFACSDTEIVREGHAYTYQTLLEMKAEYGGAELFYITGVDAIADLMTWRKPEEVLRLAQFIAATRPGFDPESLKARLPAAYLARIWLMESTCVGISSTDIRERLADNRTVRYLLPDSVMDYIFHNRLYRADVSTDSVAPAREMNT